MLAAVGHEPARPLRFAPARRGEAARSDVIAGWGCRARPRRRAQGGADQPSWARWAVPASGRGRRERPPCGSALSPRRRAPPERAQGCRRPQHRRYPGAWQGGFRPVWWTAARGERRPGRPLTARCRPGRGRAGSAAADGGGGRAARGGAGAGLGSRARAGSERAWPGGG